MTRPTRMISLLIATASLVLNIIVVQPQSKRESLRPDATRSEAIAWLKSHIPFGYMLPTPPNGEVRRWTIGGLHSQDCRLSYDITIQTLDRESSYFERQLWQLDLAGLNPQMIRVQPATEKEPARIEVTSFDPRDPDLIRQVKVQKPFFFLTESVKTTFHPIANRNN